MQNLWLKGSMINSRTFWVGFAAISILIGHAAPVWASFVSEKDKRGFEQRTECSREYWLEQSQGTPISDLCNVILEDMKNEALEQEQRYREEQIEQGFSFILLLLTCLLILFVFIKRKRIADYIENQRLNSERKAIRRRRKAEELERE